MNAKRFLLCAALCALALSGCGPQPKPVPPLTREAVVGLMDQRAQTLKTLRADIALNVKMSGMRSAQNFSASFAAASPSSVRLRASHALLDYKPIDLGCDGATWWVRVHYQETDRVDFGALAGLDPFDSDVPIRPDQILAILGMTPIRNNPSVSDWVFTVYPGHYLLQEIVRAGGAEFVATRITIDGDTNLITRYETLFPSGRTDMLATLENYRTIGGFPVPRNIHVKLLGRKQESRLDFAFSNVRVNPALPADVFKPLDFDSIPQRYRHPLSPAPGRVLRPDAPAALSSSPAKVY